MTDQCIIKSSLLLLTTFGCIGVSEKAHLLCRILVSAFQKALFSINVSNSTIATVTGCLQFCKGSLLGRIQTQRLLPWTHLLHCCDLTMTANYSDRGVPGKKGKDVPRQDGEKLKGIRAVLQNVQCECAFVYFVKFGSLTCTFCSISQCLCTFLCRSEQSTSRCKKRRKEMRILFSFTERKKRTQSTNYKRSCGS